jgi:photosystem II stability/assembly factor-like uncharacterized protein
MRIALITLGLGAAACTASPHHTGPTTPQVLGQQTGHLQAVGQPAPMGTGALTSVSCADADHCWAVGDAGPDAPTVITATVNGGLSWEAQHLALATPPDLSGISCVTRSRCMAVGSTGSASTTGLVLTTVDAGASWEQAAIPTGSYGLIAVACSTLDNCTALVNSGVILQSAQTSDFGRTWQTDGNLPGGLQGAGDLTCTVTGSCLVAGFSTTTTGHGQGAIAVSADGGHTWVTADVPAGSGLLHDVACPTASTCLAVGTGSTTLSDIDEAKGELLDSVDGGKKWARSPTTPPVDDSYGIACPVDGVCAMVGTRWVGSPPLATGAVALRKSHGRVFTEAKSAYIPLTLTALSCPTDAGCMAVGGDTLARITLPAPAPKRASTRTSQTRESV